MELRRWRLTALERYAVIQIARLQKMLVRLGSGLKSENTPVQLELIHLWRGRLQAVESAITN